MNGGLTGLGNKRVTFYADKISEVEIMLENLIIQ